MDVGKVSSRQRVTESCSIILHGESGMCTGKWEALKMVSYWSKYAAGMCDVAMAVQHIHR